MLIVTGEVLGVGSGLGVKRPIGIAFERDGGNADSCECRRASR